MDTEKRSFRLLDEYARNKHGCFITELFLDLDGLKYIVCFRPLKAAPKPHGCSPHRYLRFRANEVHAVNAGKPLSPDMVRLMDEVLPTLAEEQNLR